MGLDMRLYRKTYVKNWDHMKPEERHEISVTKGGKLTGIKPERICTITEELAYWRKAKQIHAWFVMHIQKNKDDCGMYYVPTEKLKELLDTCQKVLADRKLAKDLLPTQEGFFFGVTEFDEYYFQDLEHTVEVLTEILKEEETGEIEYHSSW